MGNSAESLFDAKSLIEEARVHRSVYTDPSIFDREMSSIFGQTWVYVGHESEVPEAGDFKTEMLGKTPIIVVREAGGGINVLVNRCRHRAATVCEEERGTARRFQCAYHGWTYERDGSLVGLTYPSGYGESFQSERMGLLQATVGVYRGFIWATLGSPLQGLRDHLGPAMEFFDEFCDLGPTGKISLSLGRQRLMYRGNWKFQMENGVDGYHPNFVHRTAATALAEYLAPGRQKANLSKAFGEEGLATSIALGNGHSALDMRSFAPFDIDERNGGGWNLAVFPNLILIGAQVRTIVPVAVDRTEVRVQPVHVEGRDDVIEERLRTHELFYGPMGFGMPDDIEMFERVTAGLNASQVEWLELSRGTERERVVDGTVLGDVTDEVPQRAMYREWERLMSSEVRK